MNSKSARLKSSGRVKAINVQVYWNSGLSNTVEEIDWGTIEPGKSIIKKIYIKHNSRFDLTLKVSDSNWNPVEASKYITFSCDKDGSIIGRREVVVATLTLKVSNEITGIQNFSFDIIIEGVNNSL